MRALILLLFASTSLAVAQKNLPNSEFSLTCREGLLWVKVKVVGRDQPLDFLLDSGAQVSVVNLSTAKQLGLALGSKVKVRGVHTSQSGFWPQALSAKAGSVSLPDKYLALDLSAFSRACGKPVDGLIGADFFRERIVQIDYEAQAVRLLDSSEALRGATTVPLEFRECGLRVKVGVNAGDPQWMRVDTGCASALQWVTSRVRAEDCNDVMAVGLAAVAIPQTRTVVTLAGQVMRDVPTGLHAKPIFPGEAGLLGNALLSRFRTVTLDYRAKRLFLGELR